MKKGLLWMIVFWIAIKASAQSGQVIYYTDSGSVALRWNGMHQPLPEGYNVYRKKGITGEWEKISRKLLKPEWNYKDLEKILGYKTGAYLKLFGLNSDTRENLNKAAWDSTFGKKGADAFMGAMSIINPEFATALGEIFVDLDVMPGNIYSYKITCISSGGSEIELGTTPAFTVGIKKSIPQVLNLKAEAMDGAVELTWTKPTNQLKSGEVSTWKVLMASDILGPYEPLNYFGLLAVNQIKNPNESSFMAQFLENNKTYYFKVVPIDAFGHWGPSSYVIEATPMSDLSKFRPQNLKIEKSGHLAKLSWDSCSVLVFKSINGGPFLQVYPPGNMVTSKNRIWYDNNVSEGNQYRYFIKCQNERGNTGPSGDTVSWIFPDATAPNPPAISAVTVKGAIKLQWKAVADIDLLGYEIERSTNNGNQWFLLNNKPINSLIYIDSLNDKSQSIFNYRAFSIDKYYNRSGPSEQVSVRFKDVVAPTRPRITALFQTDTGITLSWESRPETDIRHFTIYSRISKNSNTVWEKSVPIYNYQFDKKILQTGVYEFAVSASDSAGNEGEKSLIQVITIEAIRYLPPPVNGKVDTVSNQVILSWETASGSQPAGFVITRIFDGKSLDIAQLGSKSNKHIYTDKTAPKGNITYEIRARNEKWEMGKPLILNYQKP